jgi:hypothetical protein
MSNFQKNSKSTLTSLPKEHLELSRWKFYDESSCSDNIDQLTPLESFNPLIKMEILQKPQNLPNKFNKTETKFFAGRSKGISNTFENIDKRDKFNLTIHNIKLKKRRNKTGSFTNLFHHKESNAARNDDNKNQSAQIKKFLFLLKDRTKSTDNDTFFRKNRSFKKNMENSYDSDYRIHEDVLFPKIQTEEEVLKNNSNGNQLKSFSNSSKIERNCKNSFNTNDGGYKIKSQKKRGWKEERKKIRKINVHLKLRGQIVYSFQFIIPYKDNQITNPKTKYKNMLFFNSMQEIVNYLGEQTQWKFRFLGILNMHIILHRKLSSKWATSLYVL